MPRRRLLSPIAAAVALLLTASTISAAPPAAGTWAALRGGASGIFAADMTVELYGSEVGPDGQVYFYGNFTNAGGDPTADYLAAYNPVTNSVHGIGSDGAGNGALDNRVYTIAWVNGILYVGGVFQSVAGIPSIDYLAAWNGTSWSGRGATGLVYNLASQGGYLYVAGSFTNMAGVATADYLAVWDGYAWTGLGNNGAGNGPFNGSVWMVKVTSDFRVFVGGSFFDAGGNADADYAAWYDPASENWQKIGTAAGSPLGGSVYALTVIGNRVVLGGNFENAGGVAQADYIAEWTGTAWKSYGSNAAGDDGALAYYVNHLALYGSNVLVAGAFTDAAGIAEADRVAVWNGTKWMALGAPALDLEAYWLDIQGRVLYTTGYFTQVAGLEFTKAIATYGLPAGPSAPRLPAGTPGLRNVKLTWSAPLTANGSPVTDYRVQYRKLGTTTWRTFADGVRTTRSAVVTGLSRGVLYQFRVLAVNDWGVGPASPVITKRAG